MDSLQPHQRRVVEERAQLHERLSKLDAFLGTETYSNLPMAEQHALDEQADHMADYLRVLTERIARFQ